MSELSIPVNDYVLILTCVTTSSYECLVDEGLPGKLSVLAC